MFSINTIITKVNMQGAYANLRVNLYKLSIAHSVTKILTLIMFV